MQTGTDAPARLILQLVVNELPSEEIVDVMVGCGFPQDRQGMNLARRAALLAGLPDTVPGTTVNRFCASSLQTIRMAAHAIKAGEGDVFIAAGVETVSRYGAGFADTALLRQWIDRGVSFVRTLPPKS